MVRPFRYMFIYNPLYDKIALHRIIEERVLYMVKEKKNNELGIKKYPVIKNVLYCLHNTACCYPLLLLMCVSVIIINIVLPTLTVYLPKMVIEEIENGSAASRLLMVVLSFTLGIAVLSSLQRFLEKNIYSHKLKMNSYYIREIANKGMTTDYCNQENERFRKLQSESFNICNGYDSNITKVYGTLITLVSNALGFIVFLSILIRLNLFVVFLSVALVVCSYLLNKRNIKWLVKHNKEKISYQQKINYISRMTGDTKYGKEIRMYHMNPWIESTYQTNIRGLSNWYGRYAAKLFKTTVFDGGLLLLRECIAYAYLLYMAISGWISVSDFVLYFGVITGFSIWLGGILEQFNSLSSINISINYLRTFLEYPDSYKKEQGKVPKEMVVPKLIELKNVYYRYEGAEEDTLKNINLTIEPSEHLGVVGLNGAGKTTLVKLICGLCNPTSGVVLYDGIDIREYNRIEYYKLFSVVFQQFSLLPVTIEEIVAESTADCIDAKRVETCLIQAGLWDKINSLPMGLQSNFSKMIYDDGVELSGGELQKLVLARALYKNAPMMILDEPTAALDPISENHLYMNYNTLMREKTTIFISHRLASTRFCNRILLIDNGTICEEGTHESLLAAKGKYYSMYEAQAKYYRDNVDYREGKNWNKN